MNIKTILFTFALIASTLSHLALAAAKGGSIFCPSGQTAFPEYLELKTFIIKNKISSSLEFLKQLRSSPKFCGFLQNPVLNAQSHALHNLDVSPEFPRIILHLGGTTMMTVGNPEKDSSQMFEVIHYNQAAAKFEFKIINFATIVNGHPTDETFVEDAASADFSKFTHESYLKPAPLFNCNTCHDASEGAGIPVPRWQLKSFWQGAFAKNDNRIFKTTVQYSQWIDFLKGTLADPKKGALYQQLNLPQPRERTLTFGNTTYEFLEFPEKPNSSLAESLNKSNLQRLAAVIQNSVNWSRSKYALVGALAGCSQWGEFLPQSAGQQRQLEVMRDFESSRYAGARDHTYEVADIELAQFQAYLALQAVDRVRSVANEPRRIRMSELEYFKFKKPEIGFVEALQRSISDVNRRALQTLIARGGNVDQTIRTEEIFDLTGLNYNGVDLSLYKSQKQVPEIVDLLPDADAPFNGRIAALRFLLTGNISEPTEAWSIDKSFPFGASYRFALGPKDRGIIGVLSEIRAPFLKKHPEFQPYGWFFDKADLRRPPPAGFCELLKTKSLKAFSALAAD